LKRKQIKYFIWLNPDRASLFFAERVLMVEGESEKSLINKLIDDDKINLPNGVYILDCMGKYSIYSFMNLLNGFGIKHSVLYDDDNNKSDKHKTCNQLIASNKTPNTLKIKQLPGNLEIMLGITGKLESYQKPTHILSSYAENKIQQEKLDSFCNLVQSCFPQS
jgi:putative ATP-dependent endonuclease of the OLD family